MKRFLSPYRAGSIALLMAIALLAGCVPSAGLADQPTPTFTPTPPQQRPTPTDTRVVVGGEQPDLTPLPLATLCPVAQLDVVYNQVMDMPGEIHDAYHFAGRIPLTVDTASDPPRVRGEADLPISGGGQAGECVYTHSGTLTYVLEGQILPLPNGERELSLRVSGKANVITIGNECAGGGGSPLEPGGEIRLPYRDGETLIWREQPVPSVQTELIWTLQLLCK